MIFLKRLRNNIASRKDVDTTVRFGDLVLQAPILSANMDTVTGVRMARTMRALINAWNQEDRWQTDQDFLKTIVYPQVWQQATIHDSFFAMESHARVFPGASSRGAVCGTDLLRE